MTGCDKPATPPPAEPVEAVTPVPVDNGIKHVNEGESLLTTLGRWVRGIGSGESGAGGAGAAAAEGGIVSSGLSSIGSIFGLSGTAALMAGAAVVTLVLGGAAYAGSRYLGGRAADAPIQAGPAMAGDHTRNVMDPPYIQGVENDAYGVFVGGGYNEVIVGQLSVIMETPTSSLIGWGTDSNKKVKDSGANFRMVAGPFKGPFDARQAFDKLKVPNSERIKPFASGTCAKFTFDGKEHDFDNAFRLLR